MMAIGMTQTLLVYSTVDGQTRTICERLSAVLESAGDETDMASMEQLATIDLDAYDKIIVGASIRYGKHRADVRNFLIAERGRLSAMPHAFFSVSAVARKPNRNSPQTNPYLKRFVQDIGWRPNNLAVFAGRIDYPHYSWFERELIRLIMWMTGGPTARDASVEFTDWQAVETYGERLAAL